MSNAADVYQPRAGVLSAQPVRAGPRSGARHERPLRHRLLVGHHSVDEGRPSEHGVLRRPARRRGARPRVAARAGPRSRVRHRRADHAPRRARLGRRRHRRRAAGGRHRHPSLRLRRHQVRRGRRPPPRALGHRQRLLAGPRRRLLRGARARRPGADGRRGHRARRPGRDRPAHDRRAARRLLRTPARRHPGRRRGGLRRVDPRRRRTRRHPRDVAGHAAGSRRRGTTADLARRKGAVSARGWPRLPGRRRRRWRSGRGRPRSTRPSRRGCGPGC